MSMKNLVILAGCLVMFCAKANPVGDGDGDDQTSPPVQPPYVQPPYVQPPHVATYLDSVPYGCAHKKDTAEYVNLPAGFSAMTPWLQARHNPIIAPTSCVEVDYVRAYSEVVSGNTIYWTLLVTDEYNTWSTSSGGMYTIGFPTDDHTPMPATTIDGILNFCPSDIANNVWHWWPDRVPYTTATGKFVVEVRLRLTGGACVQIGADWWRDMDAEHAGYNVNNKEVGTSKWYFASPDWQIITFSNK